MSIEIVNKIDPIESVDAKFRLLMVREYSRALRKITHKVRSASIAEDIIQKTLLRLWQKYPNKSSNELGPLFNTILQNITMDHFREKLRDLHVY